jgi:hypothetical protein
MAPLFDLTLCEMVDQGPSVKLLQIVVEQIPFDGFKTLWVTFDNHFSNFNESFRSIIGC